MLHTHSSGDYTGRAHWSRETAVVGKGIRILRVVLEVYLPWSGEVRYQA